ncbi:MAG: hypothetical protein ACI80L_002510 [Pseudohongiellaceae bacterium]|jgi:hypothetical protein
MKNNIGSLEWIDALSPDVISKIQKVIDDLLLRFPFKMVGLAVFHDDMRHFLIKPMPTAPISLDRKLCIHGAVLDRDIPITIYDASSSRRWQNHPQVAAGMKFAFISLVSLRNQNGTRFGALSILDTKPDSGYSIEDSDYLQQCSAQIEDILFGSPEIRS